MTPLSFGAKEHDEAAKRWQSILVQETAATFPGFLRRKRLQLWQEALAFLGYPSQRVGRPILSIATHTELEGDVSKNQSTTEEEALRVGTQIISLEGESSWSGVLSAHFEKRRSTTFLCHYRDREAALTEKSSTGTSLKCDVEVLAQKLAGNAAFFLSLEEATFPSLQLQLSAAMKKLGKSTLSEDMLQMRVAACALHLLGSPTWVKGDRIHSARVIEGGSQQRTTSSLVLWNGERLYLGPGGEDRGEEQFCTELPPGFTPGKAEEWVDYGGAEIAPVEITPHSPSHEVIRQIATQLEHYYMQAQVTPGAVLRRARL